MCASIYRFLCELIRVPEGAPLYDILNDFQKGHSHMAVVVKYNKEKADSLKQNWEQSKLDRRLGSQKHPPRNFDSNSSKGIWSYLWATFCYLWWNKSQTFGSVVEKIFQIIFWFQLGKVVVFLTFDGSCFSLMLVLWLWKRYSAKDTGRKSRSNQWSWWSFA